MIDSVFDSKQHTIQIKFYQTQSAEGTFGDPVETWYCSTLEEAKKLKEEAFKDRKRDGYLLYRLWYFEPKWKQMKKFEEIKE